MHPFWQPFSRPVKASPGTLSQQSRMAQRRSKLTKKSRGRATGFLISFSLKACFQQTLRHAVELDRHLALLVGRVVLVQEVLGSRLINRLDSGRISNSRFRLIAGSNGRVELLQRGLQCALGHLVVHRLGSVYLHALLCRLDVPKTPPLFFIRQCFYSTIPFRKLQALFP